MHRSRLPPSRAIRSRPRHSRRFRRIRPRRPSPRLRLPLPRRSHRSSSRECRGGGSEQEREGAQAARNDGQTAPDQRAGARDERRRSGRRNDRSRPDPAIERRGPGCFRGGCPACARGRSASRRRTGGGRAACSPHRLDGPAGRGPSPRPGRDRRDARAPAPQRQHLDRRPRGSAGLHASATGLAAPYADDRKPFVTRSLPALLLFCAGAAGPGAGFVRRTPSESDARSEGSKAGDDIPPRDADSRSGVTSVP